MDYTKYLKIVGAAAALVLAYALGHHQGLTSRPVAARPAMVQHHLAALRAAQCNCHKHNAKPKVAKHKKHKEKAGKAKQEAPPTKN